MMDVEMSYDSVLSAIRTGKGLKGTVEVNPAYGIYHYDGHRKCNIVMSPSESIKMNNVCPICKKELTLGVDHRVEEIADREEGFRPKNAKEYYEMIPLSEVLAAGLGKGVATKTVWAEYNKSVEGTNEFDV